MRAGKEFLLGNPILQHATLRGEATHLPTLIVQCEVSWLLWRQIGFLDVYHLIGVLNKMNTDNFFLSHTDCQQGRDGLSRDVVVTK